MTNQEAFDRATDGMLKQGKRSERTIDGVTYCAFRGRYGRKCAVGFCIPNKEYSKNLELNSSIEFVAGAVPSLHGVSCDLLGVLQDVHDICEPEVWRARLRKVAEEFELEWNHG